MGILKNERSSTSNSKDDNRQEGIVNVLVMQQDFEAKREEFRKYLERAGVIDALTKVLISLYEETEKPDDALEYVCKYLGGITDDTCKIQNLEKELEDAKLQIAELQTKLSKLELEESTSA